SPPRPTSKKPFFLTKKKPLTHLDLQAKNFSTSRKKNLEMGNAKYQNLADDLGLPSAHVRDVVENYFQENEEWLCDRGNHSKWNAVRVDRLIATKTIATDKWLSKAVELGDSLGVQTANIERAALHSLHNLLKKKVDEKLAVRAKHARGAAKDMAAQMKQGAAQMDLEAARKALEASTTIVDAADQVMAAAEIRTDGATLEAAASQTRSDAAEHEMQLIDHRTVGALREEAASNVRYSAAKGEEAAANLRQSTAQGEEELMKRVAALKLKAAEDEAEAARLHLARAKHLYTDATASGSRSDRTTSTASTSSSGASRRPDRLPSGKGRRFGRGVPGPGRSTTQDRGASGSSTEVADEQDAVMAERLRQFKVSGDPKRKARK
ncbi:hypothetical protein FN846DRAFT_986796, partial [Sphaerosporella brunnea]